MDDQIKKTPLFDWHAAHGAKMGAFGGYQMPLWYPSGVKHEHLAVLTLAGLFDTSHMAVLTAEGPHAFDLLQLCFSRDLNACLGKAKTPLVPGRCVYGVFLKESGHVLDDAIVYRMGRSRYMIVVNAGLGGAIAAHVGSYRNGRTAQVIDLTDRVGKLDLQGPKAAKIISRILARPEEVLKDMIYFSFKGHFDEASPRADEVRLVDGTPILISRTGYTGEFGFEIFVETSQLLNLWEMILGAGEEFGVLTCGLAARDSVRMGAVLPLSHQDIGPWPFLNNPWSFALPFNSQGNDFTKTFVGSDALKRVSHAEHTYPFAGYDLRKVSLADRPVVLDGEGNQIGSVLTCVGNIAIGRREDRIYSITSPDKPKDFSPGGLSCGFIKVRSRFHAGDIVELRDRRRKIKVTIMDDICPDRTGHRPIREMLN